MSKYSSMRLKSFALWGIRGLSTSSFRLAMATPTLPLSTNPVLADWSSTFGLPPFASIEPEHFAPAFDEALAAHRSEVKAIATNPLTATFDNTIAALDKAGALKSKVRGSRSHLHPLQLPPSLPKYHNNPNPDPNPNPNHNPPLSRPRPTRLARCSRISAAQFLPTLCRLFRKTCPVR